MLRKSYWIPTRKKPHRKMNKNRKYGKKPTRLPFREPCFFNPAGNLINWDQKDPTSNSCLLEFPRWPLFQFVRGRASPLREDVQRPDGVSCYNAHRLNSLQRKNVEKLRNTDRGPSTALLVFRVVL
jgi:hypothetical protein